MTRSSTAPPRTRTVDHKREGERRVPDAALETYLADFGHGQATLIRRIRELAATRQGGGHQPGRPR